MSFIPTKLPNSDIILSNKYWLEINSLKIVRNSDRLKSRLIAHIFIDLNK